MKKLISLYLMTGFLVAGCGKTARLTNTQSVEAPVAQAVKQPMTVPVSALFWTVGVSAVCIIGTVIYYKHKANNAYEDGYNRGAGAQFIADAYQAEVLYKNGFSKGSHVQLSKDINEFTKVRNDSYTLGYDEGSDKEPVRQALYKGKNQGSEIAGNPLKVVEEIPEEDKFESTLKRVSYNDVKK